MSSDAPVMKRAASLARKSTAWADFVGRAVAAERAFACGSLPFARRGEDLVVPRFDHARHDGVDAHLRGQLAGQRAGHDLQGPLGGGVGTGPARPAGLHGERQVVDDAAVARRRGGAGWPAA